MLEEKSSVERSPVLPSPPVPQKNQRRQMAIALGLLLIALTLVLIKDRDFWFPSSPVPADNTIGEAAVSQKPAAPASAEAPPPAKTRTKIKAEAATPTPSESGMTPVVTNRAVLPPLEVEVVAGNQRHVIRPGNPSVKIDMQPAGDTVPAGTSTPAVSGSLPTNASERVLLSPDTVQIVSRPVEPNYPMLAKQMKVQGSVILQALIGRDGNIQDLRVLSGPAILSAAAREAVKQWKFKPYLQSGQAVETEARITVNFTISTY
jgi:protein TonB